MKGKRRIFLNLIVAAAFFIVVIVAFFSVFSLAEVRVRFVLGENGGAYEGEIRETLEAHRGKNLLFLDTEEIRKELAAYPYFEVKKLEKSYPNGLEVELSERREMFLFESGGASYILDGDGFILAEGGQKDGLIRLTAKTKVFSKRALAAVASVRFAEDDESDAREDIAVLSAEVGSTLSLEDGGRLSLVYQMSELADYTDTIEEIEVRYGEIGGEVLEDEVIFHMRTGVEIWVYSALDAGVDKMALALQAFNAGTDYQKSTRYIVVYRNEETNELEVYFTEHSPDGQAAGNG